MSPTNDRHKPYSLLSDDDPEQSYITHSDLPIVKQFNSAALKVGDFTRKIILAPFCFGEFQPHNSSTCVTPIKVGRVYRQAYSRPLGPNFAVLFSSRNSRNKRHANVFYSVCSNRPHLAIAAMRSKMQNTRNLTITETKRQNWNGCQLVPCWLLTDFRQRTMDCRWTSSSAIQHQVCMDTSACHVTFITWLRAGEWSTIFTSVPATVAPRNDEWPRCHDFSQDVWFSLCLRTGSFFITFA